MRVSGKFLALILLTQALVLAAAFYGFASRLGRAQLQREASVFDVTTNLQYTDLIANPETSAAAALIQTVRHISRMPGIIGACLFDDQGQPVLCVPDELGSLQSAPPPPAAAAELLHNFAMRWRASPVRVDRHPFVLQIDVPLRGAHGQAVAFLRFYREGASFAAAMRQQQRLLAALAALAIALTGGITAYLFATYGRRLTRIHGILRARNEELLDAQRHLLLATEMTAIGSMTAHLIHDLKSYANRIGQSLRQARKAGAQGNADLEDAFGCVTEMEQHIREFLSILRSTASDFQSTYCTDELLAILYRKLKPVADKADVVLKFQNDFPSFTVDFKKGNFLILILQNILHNAIETTPAGEAVVLTVSSTATEGVFRVADRGPGIPPERQQSLFLPKNSFKEGGTGLGLALCGQMAHHIGAGISLEASGPEGTRFKVAVPIAEPETAKS